MNELTNKSNLWSGQRTTEFAGQIPNWFPKDSSYWLAAFITGIAAVSYAGLVKYAEHFAQDIYARNPYFLIALSPICFTIGWWLVYRFAPEARGSGIPQVMAAIESFDQNKSEHPYLRNLLGLKTAFIKVLSSFFCILGGGAVGREGPTIQIAASIFHFVNHKTDRIFQKANYQFGLIAGGAAGIAAAFNTPLGGLVYAVEELATSHLSRFKTSLISGVIIAGLVSQWLLGSYLYLGFPQISHIGIKIVIISSLVGAVTGACGALFSIILQKVSKQIRRIQKPTDLALVAAFCGLILAGAAILLDSQVMGPGREVVLNLLFKDGYTGSFKLAAVRFISPLVSYLSGCAGGIFAPSLGAGAAIGSMIGGLFNMPGENIFILVGMIGFLTGVTHAPFTAFVLVLEMTDKHTAILPMMLASLFASMVTKLVEPVSFYEQVKSIYLKPMSDSPAVKTEL